MRRYLSLPKDSLQIFPELAQLNEIILEHFSGDGVAVVAHLLRAGLRASGLLEMSAKEDLESINQYCGDAILDLARARLQYKATHGQTAYREWMKPSTERRRVPAVSGNAERDTTKQIPVSETGHPDASSQTNVHAVEEYTSSLWGSSISKAIQLPEPVLEDSDRNGLIEEDLNPAINSGAVAGPDLLAQFRGNPLF